LGTFMVDDMTAKAYVVHLTRARSRRPLALALAESLPIPTSILAAVDGKTLSAAEMRRLFLPRMHSPRYPFRLSDTEIGCFLSHRKAWQSILTDGCDAGLIVEDDVCLASDRFADVLAAAINSIRPDEYVRFPVRERGELGAVARSVGNVTLLEPRLPGLGMQMQLIGREAARMLLEATATFDRPVDSLVQMQWIHSARVLSARPIVVREVGRTNGGSTVQQKAGILSKMSHELQRPLLRLSIRLANDRWRRRTAA